MRKAILMSCLLLAALGAQAQQVDSVRTTTLEAVDIRTKGEGVKRMAGAVNGTEIGQDELFRAACCNLGESFVNNPSVDVNYNDATVGARQIKLLGLSGQYVQMLVEGLPMMSGALQPYMLDFVPGAWMRSISVSKGTSSVKQGYQSITGQIDVEYLKPDEDQGVLFNLYGDSHMKGEGNVVANVHLNKYLSTELVGHVEKDFMRHDENDDGWIDMPAVGQTHLQNRWKYRRGRYVMHAGIGFMQNERLGGQTGDDSGRYMASVDIRRWESYMKHALLLNQEHNTNIALTATLGSYNLGSVFGNRHYDFNQRALTSQLMLEHDFTEAHNISTGVSLNADRFEIGNGWNEVTPGAYAQYTFKPDYRFTLMAGLRADRFYSSSDESRWFVIPRVHVKWMLADWVTLRASTGKGVRPVHPQAEYHYLLASGRTVNLPNTLAPEEAWNSGISATLYIPIDGNSLTVNTEYYYTDFVNQAVVDYDTDPTAINVYSLTGVSYSHTFQIDASYPIIDELELMAAFRYNKVMCTYGNKLMEKPLQSRYKGLVTLSWKPMMGLWQVDFTFQLNGPGRMPTPYIMTDGSTWDETFPAYPQINMQLTREFRHFSIYLGGENLTNYCQPNPVIGAENPWSAEFDPTLIWGPVRGIMAYGGIRLNLWRM